MSGRKSRNKGKRFELEIAHALDTERTGTRGKSDADHGDIIHDTLFVQCKRRAALPVSLMTWWNETTAAASRVDKMPLLVIREDRGEALVLMRLGDLADAVYDKQK